MFSCQVNLVSVELVLVFAQTCPGISLSLAQREKSYRAVYIITQKKRLSILNQLNAYFECLWLDRAAYFLIYNLSFARSRCRGGVPERSTALSPEALHNKFTSPAPFQSPNKSGI